MSKSFSNRIHLNSQSAIQLGAVCLALLLFTVLGCSGPTEITNSDLASVDTPPQTEQDKKSNPPTPPDEPETKTLHNDDQNQQGQELEKPLAHTIDIPKSWKRLSKKEEIWIDKKAGEVIVGGTICLNQGPLEMFICPEGTKEHESIVSARALASQVHACLIALKAEPGSPTSWNPEYTPAHGPSIEITMIWKDEKTGSVKKQNSREWIRNSRTKKLLKHQWVFGGSQIWVDPDTKEKLYYGDSGEMVCVSNFSTATIDLNVESSQANAGLLFEANGDNVPPIGTRVYTVFKPGKIIPPAKKKNAKKDVAEAKKTKEEDDGQDSKNADETPSVSDKQ